jgi:hypothetical protein
MVTPRYRKKEIDLYQIQLKEEFTKTHNSQLSKNQAQGHHEGPGRGKVGLARLEVNYVLGNFGHLDFGI